MVCLLLPRSRPGLVAKAATAIAALDLLLSLPLWFGWSAAPADPYGFRFVLDVPWIASLGIRYIVGVDGISMLLVLLTTVLGFLAILSSWSAIRQRENQYYAYLLILQTGMIGVFVSLDTFLFYVFWEVMLIPMYFLIGMWGGPRRIYASVKFFLFTLLGSVLDARRDPRALRSPQRADRCGHFRHPHPSSDGNVARLVGAASLGLAGVLPRLRDQGSDVSVSHVASGRARRGADGGLRHPRGRAPEDGDLRILAVQPADASRMPRNGSPRSFSHCA